MAEDAHQSYLKYAFLITPYASFLALQYLWGYWGSFRINIFSYVTLSDILKLALLPLVYFFSATALAVVIMYFTTSLVRGKTPRPALSPRGSLVINCLLILVAIAVLIFMTSQRKWIWAGLMIGALLTQILENLELSKKLVPNASLRFCIALLISVPLFSVYGIGRRDAQSVLSGDDKSRLVDARLFREHGSEAFIKKQLLEGQDKLKYVGIAGDYLFLISIDNSKIYVVKFSDVHFLEFSYQQ